MVRLELQHYEISGYDSNELLSINMLHGQELCGRAQMSEHTPISENHVYSVNIDNSLIWICKM
jgi:hypothetical protein